jgi:hypothetical protein
VHGKNGHKSDDVDVRQNLILKNDAFSPNKKQVKNEKTKKKTKTQKAKKMPSHSTSNLGCARGPEVHAVSQPNRKHVELAPVHQVEVEVVLQRRRIQNLEGHLWSSVVGEQVLVKTSQIHFHFMT